MGKLFTRIISYVF